MFTLAIDSSSKTSSIALFNDENFTEFTQNLSFNHSQSLLPNLKNLLQMSCVTKEMIDSIAISIGPGSFTGLRIGLATAKSLAYAWNLKIISVSTLESLAYHFPFNTVMTLIDAQKNSAYVQIFNRLKKISEIEIINLNDAIKKASTFDEIIICGDVCHKLKNIPDNVKIAPINLKMPRAINVAMCARLKLKENIFDNVMNLEPLYLRRSEAEILWDKRNSD